MFPLIFLSTGKNLKINIMKKNFLIITISLFLLFIFLLPLSMFGILNIGNIAGLLFGAILFCYGAFYGKINSTIKALWKKKLWKSVFSAFSLLFAVGIIFTSFATFNMLRASYNAPDKETTVIVLGCKVNSNGPSLSLLKRLEAAYAYLSENPDVPCILSGGQGADEHISEAQAMYDWLTEKGIEKERLYIENKSTSTQENLSFSKKIIGTENLPSAVTLITNNFHQYRAQKIAERYYAEVYGVSGDTPLYLLPMYYLRELGGILVEVLS